MLGSIILVHASAGVFVEGGGYELGLLLGASALAVALVAPADFHYELLNTNSG